MYYTKRLFDIIFSSLGLMLTWWIIVLAWLASTLDTGKNGFFLQKRVGKDGHLFRMIKIRTMRNDKAFTTNVTTINDSRITTVGQFFRRAKIDELPQLINVLLGEMSFVGPRPDVPGFYDTLSGDERLLLSFRPGITGPATIKYCNEEVLLASQNEPEVYNREVIYPDKVRINLQYIKNWRLVDDIKYIYYTLLHLKI